MKFKTFEYNDYLSYSLEYIFGMIGRFYGGILCYPHLITISVTHPKEVFNVSRDKAQN